MHKISFNKTSNIISIKIESSFDLQQAEQLHVEIERIIPEVKKGFTVLTDLTSLQKMDLESRESIAKYMKLFNECGVAEIIRIVPDMTKDLGFNIMSLFHYSRDIKIRTFGSLEEASKHINLYKKRSKE